MYKDELIRLHQFLVYVLKYVIENNRIENNCDEYIILNISPHHIHKTKAEHKYAIFVLCKIISEFINEKDEEILPKSICTSLNDFVIHYLNEIQLK